LKFHEKKTDNGLQVVAEMNPHAQSMAMGFFVRTGSRDETSEVSGVSHYLEHMAFKGNEKYSADDVNLIFDEIGAKYNASTSEEVTTFYAAILPEYMETAFEILSCLMQPSLRQEDFDMEKNVILEEIGMYEDQPTFVAYENLMKSHFAGHPLSRSILGSQESIKALRCEQMQEYHRQHYQTGNITLAVAGRCEWDELLGLVDKYCANWPKGELDRPVQEAAPQGDLSIITKEGHLQQHVMQMAPGPSAQNPMRYAAEILSVIVGDDHNSRMYWDLVDPGHCESAEIGFNEYDGTGTYMTYFSCQPEQTAEMIARITAIYDDVNRNGVTEEELEQAKNKIASQVVLRSERPMGRLSSLGGNWVYRGEYRSVDDDLKTVKSMSLEDIRQLLKAYPLGQTTTTTVGPLTSLNGE